mmetsp:Transcript_39232/g.116230  ORF Transcript_39232/g.116230 Transcript_39232/m.116230 type:complete len:306 (-) Transcript_39232:170-1087(-)
MHLLRCMRCGLCCGQLHRVGGDVPHGGGCRWRLPGARRRVPVYRVDRLAGHPGAGHPVEACPTQRGVRPGLLRGVRPVLLVDPRGPPVVLHRDLIAEERQEELEGEERVAARSVGAATPQQPVPPGERVQRAVRQLVPQLVPLGAVRGEVDLERAVVLGQRLVAGEDLEQVAKVVEAGEGHPPRGARMLAHEDGVTQQLTERQGLDAFLCMPGKVQTRLPEERDGLLGVQVAVDIKLQVEAPGAAEGTICTGDRDAELNRAQAVHVLSQDLVSHGSCSGARLLAEEARKLHVQGDHTPFRRSCDH